MCWSECSKIGCNVGAVGAINSQFTGLGKHDANKVKFNYLSHTKEQRGLCWENSSLWIADDSSCAAAASVGLVALKLWTLHRDWNDALHSKIHPCRCVATAVAQVFVSEPDLRIWVLPWPWALGLEISQELLFEGYFRIFTARPRERFAVWKQAMIEDQISQFFIFLWVGKKFVLLLWCGSCLSGLFPLPLYP